MWSAKMAAILSRGRWVKKTLDSLVVNQSIMMAKWPTCPGEAPARGNMVISWKMYVKMSQINTLTTILCYKAPTPAHKYPKIRLHQTHIWMDCTMVHNVWNCPPKFEHQSIFSKKNANFSLTIFQDSFKPLIHTTIDFRFIRTIRNHIYLAALIRASGPGFRGIVVKRAIGRLGRRSVCRAAERPSPISALTSVIFHLNLARTFVALRFRMSSIIQLWRFCLISTHNGPLN